MPMRSGLTFGCERSKLRACNAASTPSKIGLEVTSGGAVMYFEVKSPAEVFISVPCLVVVIRNYRVTNPRTLRDQRKHRLFQTLSSHLTE